MSPGLAPLLNSSWRTERGLLSRPPLPYARTQALPSPRHSCSCGMVGCCWGVRPGQLCGEGPWLRGRQEPPGKLRRAQWEQSGARASSVRQTSLTRLRGCGKAGPPGTAPSARCHWLSCLGGGGGLWPVLSEPVLPRGSPCPTSQKSLSAPSVLLFSVTLHSLGHDGWCRDSNQTGMDHSTCARGSAGVSPPPLSVQPVPANAKESAASLTPSCPETPPTRGFPRKPTA